MPQIAKFHYPIDASRYKVGSSKQSLLPCFHPLIKRICDERPECIIYSRLVDISGEIIENKPMLLTAEPGLYFYPSVNEMPLHACYKTFNGFKRELIKRQKNYDWLKMPYLNYIEKLYKRHKDGFIYIG